MKAFHKFFDHTADVLFVARADTLPQLFEQCAFAVEETMVEVTKVQPKKKIKPRFRKNFQLLFRFFRTFAKISVSPRSLKLKKASMYK